MERLTKRIVGGVCHYDCTDSCSSCCGCECFDVWKMLDKLAAYEDTGLAPDEIPTGLEMANVFCAMEKLKAYEDAEEQGRLVVLPCKVGAPVYILRGDVNNGWETVKKTHVEKVTGGFSIGMLNHNTLEMYDFYYLTREAAEAKLKEMEGEGKND